MSITTGTPERHAEHISALAMANVLFVVAVPALLVFVGIAARGWQAIDWLGAIVWGMLGALLMVLIGRLGRSQGASSINALDLLGSLVVERNTRNSVAVGAVIHHVNGGLLAIAWAYSLALFGLPANWATGVLWGVVLWLMAMLLLTSVGIIHPAVRQGRQDDPGPAGRNFGALTPVGMLVIHIIYGVTIGVLYGYVPLS